MFSSQSGVSGPTEFTVIIPAHNEQTVISQCLNELKEGMPISGDIDVIVVANGCSDQTVDVAKAALPQAQVLDMRQGSKILAINEGLRRARHRPIFVVDADVRVSWRSLAATADALRGDDVMIAAPALNVDLEGCDRFVRSYYNVWTRQPYIRRAMVGSGLYGLSAKALEQIGELPMTFGDDQWIRTRYPAKQRRSVSQSNDGHPVFFTVSPPLTLIDHVVIEARRRIGMDDVRQRFGTAESGPSNGLRDLLQTRGEGVPILDIVTYAAMKTAARVLHNLKKVTGRGNIWLKDMRSRQARQRP